MLEKFLSKNRGKEIAKAATINHSHIPEMKLIANEALEALSNLGYSIERMWATNNGKSISIITNRPRVFIDMSPDLRSGKMNIDKDYTDKESKKLRKIRKDESLSDEESPNESKETSSGNEKVLKIIEYVRKMVKRKGKS